MEVSQKPARSSVGLRRAGSTGLCKASDGIMAVDRRATSAPQTRSGSTQKDHLGSALDQMNPLRDA